MSTARASLGLTKGEVMMEMTKDLLLEAKNVNAMPTVSFQHGRQTKEH